MLMKSLFCLVQYAYFMNCMALTFYVPNGNGHKFKFSHLKQGVPYHDQNKRNYYDLVLPKNYTSNSPILIWLHSGAWVTEDIQASNVMVDKLAQKYNIVTALVRYRLSKKNGENDVKHPMHLKDSLNAFFNVSKSLKDYNLNNNKVFLGGHSAGAHLAALMALDATNYINKQDTSQLDIIRNIKGVISIGGIFDLELLSKQDTSYIDDFIIPAFGDNKYFPSIWNAASPQYITKQVVDKIQYNIKPRYLLIGSNQDPLVDFEQSLNFSKQLYHLGFKNITVDSGAYGKHDSIPENSKVVSTIGRFILG